MSVSRVIQPGSGRLAGDAAHGLVADGVGHRDALGGDAQPGQFLVDLFQRPAGHVFKIDPLAAGADGDADLGAAAALLARLHGLLR